MPSSDKVLAIFRELVGDLSLRLDGAHYPADVNSRITEALRAESSDDGSLLEKDALGFHLVDWQHDAAFIVALNLLPDRFTDEEIREGIDRFLLHVPAHILEAARLGGYPTTNIFLKDDQEV